MKERLQAWGDTKVLPIVGVFAFSEHGELLLLQRHAADLGGGQWGTPGGRIDPGEAADAAIKRELYEETGIKGLRLTRLGAHLIHMPHGTVHMTSYRMDLPKATKIVLDPEEHQAFAWFRTAGLREKEGILWGLPSILRDFGLLEGFGTDLTLADGSSVECIA